MRKETTQKIGSWYEDFGMFVSLLTADDPQVHIITTQHSIVQQTQTTHQPSTFYHPFRSPLILDVYQHLVTCHSNLSRDLHTRKTCFGPSSGRDAWPQKLSFWPTSDSSPRFFGPSSHFCLLTLFQAETGISDLAEVFVCTDPHLFSQHNVTL